MASGGLIPVFLSTSESTRWRRLKRPCGGQTDIHHLTDNTRSWDVVRVVTRLVLRLQMAIKPHRIKRFRAGVEGRIAVQMRGRGMKRCRAEGRQRFELFVAAAVLANNLMRIARPLLENASRRRRRAA